MSTTNVKTINPDLISLGYRHRNMYKESDVMRMLSNHFRTAAQVARLQAQIALQMDALVIQALQEKAVDDATSCASIAESMRSLVDENRDQLNTIMLGLDPTDPERAVHLLGYFEKLADDVAVGDFASLEGIADQFSEIADEKEMAYGSLTACHSVLDSLEGSMTVGDVWSNLQRFLSDSHFGVSFKETANRLLDGVNSIDARARNQVLGAISTIFDSVKMRKADENDDLSEMFVTIDAGDYTGITPSQAFVESIDLTSTWTTIKSGVSAVWEGMKMLFTEVIQPLLQKAANEAQAALIGEAYVKEGGGEFMNLPLMSGELQIESQSMNFAASLPFLWKGVFGDLDSKFLLCQALIHADDLYHSNGEFIMRAPDKFGESIFQVRFNREKALLVSRSPWTSSNAIVTHQVMDPSKGVDITIINSNAGLNVNGAALSLWDSGGNNVYGMWRDDFTQDQWTAIGIRKCLPYSVEINPDLDQKLIGHYSLQDEGTSTLRMSEPTFYINENTPRVYKSSCYVGLDYAGWLASVSDTKRIMFRLYLNNCLNCDGDVYTLNDRYRGNGNLRIYMDNQMVCGVRWDTVLSKCIAAQIPMNRLALQLEYDGSAISLRCFNFETGESVYCQSGNESQRLNFLRAMKQSMVKLSIEWDNSSDYGEIIPSLFMSEATYRGFHEFANRFGVMSTDGESMLCPRPSTWYLSNDGSVRYFKWSDRVSWAVDASRADDAYSAVVAGVNECFDAPLMMTRATVALTGTNPSSELQPEYPSIFPSLADIADLELVVKAIRGVKPKLPQRYSNLQYDSDIPASLSSVEWAMSMSDRTYLNDASLYNEAFEADVGNDTALHVACEVSKRAYYDILSERNLLWEYLNFGVQEHSFNTFLPMINEDTLDLSQGKYHHNNMLAMASWNKEADANVTFDFFDALLTHTYFTQPDLIAGYRPDLLAKRLGTGVESWMVALSDILEIVSRPVFVEYLPPCHGFRLKSDTENLKGFTKLVGSILAVVGAVVLIGVSRKVISRVSKASSKMSKTLTSKTPTLPDNLKDSNREAVNRLSSVSVRQFEVVERLSQSSGSKLRIPIRMRVNSDSMDESLGLGAISGISDLNSRVIEQGEAIKVLKRTLGTFTNIEI